MSVLVHWLARGIAGDRATGVSRLFGLIIVGFSLVGTSTTFAVDYPTRPVRWIVGFAAGGSTDTLARLMGQWLSERLGQQFVVENRAGASGNVAAQAVVNSPPDGHTLLFLSSANAINATFNKNLPFDILTDIAPVAGLVQGPNVMVLNPSVPATTVAEFIAHAKAHPGKINMASPGVGTTVHLSGELFKAKTGIDLVHVPYRGSAPAIVDLMSGQVHVMFNVLLSTLPHIKSGKLRALAVTTRTRSEALPDVPAMAEIVAGYEAVIWFGVGVPKGTPSEIIQKLNHEINAGLADPNIKARLAEFGSAPIAMTPVEFGAFLAAETKKWGKVIRVSGVTLE